MAHPPTRPVTCAQLLSAKELWEFWAKSAKLEGGIVDRNHRLGGRQGRRACGGTLVRRLQKLRPGPFVSSDGDLDQHAQQDRREEPRGEACPPGVVDRDSVDVGADVRVHRAHASASRIALRFFGLSTMTKNLPKKARRATRHAGTWQRTKAGAVAPNAGLRLTLILQIKLILGST
jgi:hypothetical protein